MKHLFIINPVAGNGLSLKYKTIIEDIFKHRQDEFSIEITQRKGHATEIVKEYVKRDDFRVYALGGDGTINEVLNGIIGSNSSLAIIPCGTGNDFIKTVVKKNNLDDILLNTIDGYEQYIDIAKANKRYFINISSVGLDSEVAYNAKIFKGKKFIPNNLAYLFSLLYTTFSFKSFDIDISIDDNFFKHKSMLLTASNGKCYGGGIPITPEADIKDGLLDVCLIKNIKLFKLLKFIPKAFKGEHGEAEEVEFFRGKKITVKSPKEFTLNTDGELFKCKEVTFEILPSKVKLVIPKNITL